MADCSEAPHPFVEWSGCDKSGVNLIYAFMPRGNLTGVNLSNAIVKFSNLDTATLIDANLTGAQFIGTNLQGADLTGADLTGANLTAAGLAYANLTGATLVNVTFDFTTLNGATLPYANLADALAANPSLYYARGIDSLVFAAPEPEAWILMGLAVFGVGGVLRTRRRGGPCRDNSASAQESRCI